MGTKLKLILKQAPWSLVAKALLFVAAWLIEAPYVLFLAFSAYLYFVPSFQSLRFIIPFTGLMVLSFVLTPSVWVGVALGILFFLIIGSKELMFAARASVYEVIVFVFAFFSLLRFFEVYASWGHGGFIAWSVVLGLFFFFLMRGFLGITHEEGETQRIWMYAGIGAFLVWQLMLVLMFLPFHFFSQAALGAIYTGTVLNFINQYSHKEEDRVKLVVYVVMCVLVGTVVFFTTKWGFV